MPVLNSIPENQINKDFQTIIFKGAKLEYEEEKAIITSCFNIIEFIQITLLINTSFKSLGLDVQIDNTIFYKAIQLLQEGKTFNDSDLRTYLKESTKIELFRESISRFCNTVNLDFCSTAENLLLGIPDTKPESMSKKRYIELDDQKGDIFFNYYCKQQSIEETIQQIKKFRKVYLEQIKQTA